MATTGAAPTKSCGCTGAPCPCGDKCECHTAGSGAATQRVPAGGFCECGEKCSCETCTCSKVTESGEAYCKCGKDCRCDPCTCLKSTQAAVSA